MSEQEKPKYEGYTLSQLVKKMPEDYENYLLAEAKRESDEEAKLARRTENLENLYGEILTEPDETPEEQARRVKKELLAVAYRRSRNCTEKM